MAKTPLLVFHNGFALTVPPGFRDHLQYRQRRRSLTRARTYIQAVFALENAAGDRSYIAADLTPHVDWARRFFHTTALFLSLPKTDPKHAQGERGLKVLIALLTGTPLRVGRPAMPPVTSTEEEAVRRRRIFWADKLPIHVTADQVVTVVKANWPWAWPRAHELALRRFLRKPRCRRSDLIRLVIGWELGMSARRVTQALNPIEREVLHA